MFCAMHLISLCTHAHTHTHTPNLFQLTVLKMICNSAFAIDLVLCVLLPTTTELESLVISGTYADCSRKPGWVSVSDLISKWPSLRNSLKHLDVSQSMPPMDSFPQITSFPLRIQSGQEMEHCKAWPAVSDLYISPPTAESMQGTCHWRWF